MEVFAILGGFTAKIYDELIDNNIEVNPIILEGLKGLQWMSLTALSINDFTFNILFVSLVFLNYFFDKNAYTSPYEKTFPILLLPLFTNINTAKFPYLLDLGIFLSIIGGLFIDSILFKNIEISISKCIFRTILAWMASVSFCILKYYNFNSTIMNVFLYFISYAIVSSIFQLYTINQSLEDYLLPTFQSLPQVPNCVHATLQSTGSVPLQSSQIPVHDLQHLKAIPFQ